MKALNLYAGIGGNRKLWEGVDVTAVEWDEETANVYRDYFPEDKVIVGDAHRYLKDNYKHFDFVWASPPCPTHSRLNRANKTTTDLEYPDMKLYEEIIFLREWFDGKFCVENVVPYYEPLIPPSTEIHRHYYWANFKIGRFDGFDKERKHNGFKGSDTLYGFDIKESNISDKRKALRNMVDPKIGKYILDRAKGIHAKSQTEQTALFTN